jgi:hypothetical protein
VIAELVPAARHGTEQYATDENVNSVLWLWLIRGGVGCCPA